MERPPHLENVVRVLDYDRHSESSKGNQKNHGPSNGRVVLRATRHVHFDHGLNCSRRARGRWRWGAGACGGRQAQRIYRREVTAIITWKKPSFATASPSCAHAMGAWCGVSACNLGPLPQHVIGLRMQALIDAPKPIANIHPQAPHHPMHVRMYVPHAYVVAMHVRVHEYVRLRSTFGAMCLRRIQTLKYTAPMPRTKPKKPS